MSTRVSENIRNVCFFCSQIILDKKTEEHIIPNSLLGKLGIKEQTLGGQGNFQYSRIKVPAHARCNNEFGSRYENTVLDLLNNTNELFETLSSSTATIDIEYRPASDERSIIITWLSKIYYGLFYHDYLKLKQDAYKQVCEDIINSENFKIIQQSYFMNHGFSLPSSIFVFRTLNENFDLRTFAAQQTILLKIKELVLIICIADGQLTNAYIDETHIELLREEIISNERENPSIPSHIKALIEILAIRSCIPKAPKFGYSEDQIINMSFNTMVSNPRTFYKIDETEYKEQKQKITDAIKKQL